ncbi:diaminopimelate dehydrogenase [Eubacteriales bacterium OttesenSCG-928-N14]|nr:diaminopimelate dehydrogenase [Eubacteriales bacterium OttesenSCG-928-N14]
MQPITAAILGYGNIGKAVLEAINAADDFTLAGIVRRNPSAPQPQELSGVNIVSDLGQLAQVDVALLCAPSRQVPELAAQVLSSGIRTVDSFDIHTQIVSLRTQLDETAKANNTVSIVSAGWDPGTDSVLRALMLAMAPNGITHTNFGPGMSMGHSTAVKNMDGVVDALSITIPIGNSLHRRMVYIELEPGADEATVANTIKTDPYFVHDETHVTVVPSVAALKDMGHGVRIERIGVSGSTHNQQIGFDMRINNPALTAQIMVSCARASMRLAPGCYTMIEIPPIYLLPGQTDDLVKALV